MKNLYLLLFSLLSVISFPVAFADDARVWYPYPESDTVDEPGWIIFGVIALGGIAITLGTYYRRKNTKKPDDK
jgi:hypothetical protein